MVKRLELKAERPKQKVGSQETGVGRHGAEERKA